MPFDLIMLLGLHSLWRSHTAKLHNDADVRPAKMIVRESVGAYVKGVKTQVTGPDWLSRIEPLEMLKEFRCVNISQKWMTAPYIFICI